MGGKVLARLTGVVNCTRKCQAGHTGKYFFFLKNARTFYGLLKASPTIFKDLQLMKNTDQSDKILLQKC